MKVKLSPAFISAILLVLVLLSAGCTQTTSPAATPAVTVTTAVTLETTTVPAETTAPQAATREELVAFVQEAVTYAKANGKEKALAEFSDPKGSFVRGELYIYAYDYNGTTIAHPVNPEKIGVNRLDEKDADGNYFIRELMDATNSGDGFVEYTYINPLHNDRVEKKLGYVMKVDDEWWLGSGIYLGPVETPVADEKNDTSSESVTPAVTTNT